MKTNERTTRNPSTLDPATVNPFSSLLKEFANAVDEVKEVTDPANPRNPENDPADRYPYICVTGYTMTREIAIKHWKITIRDAKKNYTNVLQELATACAYSVLKKCILASANPTLTATRRDLTRGLHDRDCADYCANNATETEYNENGDPRVITVDRDLADGLKKLTADNLGVGVDLVSVATLAILDEVKKQTDRDPDLGCDLERPYTVKKLSKRVYIQTATSVAWQEVETLPIKEVYKAVRRYIMETASERSDPRAKYCYLEDLAEDENGNETADRIYYRLGKYSDLGGYVKDFNGQETFIVADNETAKTATALVNEMNLTARQAQILKYRRQGYGYKAIATALGVSPQAIAKTVKQIQEKARAIGLDPEKTPQ